MIHLIVANDMRQGEEVVKNMKLNVDDCAVINQPHFFDHIEFKRGETVYAHNRTHPRLMGYLHKAIALANDPKSITVKIVKP